MQKLFRDFPSQILEELYFWVVQNSAGFLSSSCDDEDDKDILQRQCRYLSACSQIFLNTKMKKIEQSFTVNLSLFPNFGGFRIKDEENDKEISDMSILASDEFLTDIDEVQNVRDPFIDFFEAKPTDLESFEMGLFLQGRPDEGFEAKKYSLIWTNPTALISFVDNCAENLTHLNLDGYEELNDLAVEYLAGKTERNMNKGLKKLVYIKLPKKSFISEYSFKVLIENLLNLEFIDHPGKLGLLCENERDFLDDKRTFNLKLFNQMELIDSGAVNEEADEDEDVFEIKPWNPSIELLQSIRQSFPKLNKLKLLINDEYLSKFAEADFCDNLEEIEVHSTWSGIGTLDILAISASNTLTKISLEVLEGYSWTIIASIGKHCHNLTSFHMTIWSEYIENVDILEDILEDKEERFKNLTDLSIKCEDHIDYFPNIIFFYFMTCNGNLRIVNFVAPVSWITPDVIKLIVTHRCLKDLEMFMLNNTSTEAMQLGNEEIQCFLDTFPNLTVLGNLRTWLKVDYFDSNSNFYFKTESEFVRLKEKAKENNWDIDFELENLDFMNNL